MGVKLRYLRTINYRNGPTPRSVKILIGVVTTAVIIDVAVVMWLVIFPSTKFTLSNMMAFETNGLGAGKSSKIYRHMSLDGLSSSQRKDTSFNTGFLPEKEENIANHMGSNKNLFLQGFMAIPNLKIYQPIYYGNNANVLANGVGTIKDNQVMGVGNYAVSGYNIGPDYNFTFGHTLNFGGYLSKIQMATPTKLYLTDGENIYTYSQRKKQTTNIANQAVISDDYPISNSEYSYDISNSANLGLKNTVKGLSLNNNNISKKVASFSIGDIIKDDYKDGNSKYELSFKSDYPYAKYLSAKNFNLTVETDDMLNDNVSVEIKDVKVSGNDVKLDINLFGDVKGVASTVGSKIIVKQLQNQSYFTIVTPVVTQDGPSNTNRIVNTASLASVKTFKESPQAVQNLFPMIKSKKIIVNDVNKDIVERPNDKVSIFQHIFKAIVKVFVSQANCVSSKI